MDLESFCEDKKRNSRTTMKGNLSNSIDALDECIGVVETEIKQIRSRNVTDAQLEELGSYTVLERFEDLVKGVVLPAPPFPKDAVKDDDLSSVASSATAPSRRSRRGGKAANDDDDDAESVDTRSTRRSVASSSKGGTKKTTESKSTRSKRKAEDQPVPRRSSRR